MQAKITRTPYYSLKCGPLTKGCKYCVKGEKLVLYVTGECPRHCFYCPLSDKKKDRDVIYANEWKLKNENDTAALIKEAELTDAKGAGITGGDPLVKCDRTVRYIRLLKKRFGRSFHIHLYTIPQSITLSRLKRLYDAGLDEIRFHPDFYNKTHWKKIALVKKYDWDIGIEIPVIPQMGDRIEAVFDYFIPHVHFFNLNELEYTDHKAYDTLKLVAKSSISYGIKGSKELAKKLMEKYGNKIPIHYCSTTLKDRVQLATRIQKRAKNVAAAYDKITEEGLLYRGALYPLEFVPGIGYREKLEKVRGAEREKILDELSMLREKLIKKYKIAKNKIAVDDSKLRLLTTPAVAKKVKEKKLKCALVTEYPTWDGLEIEVEFV